MWIAVAAAVVLAGCGTQTYQAPTEAIVAPTAGGRVPAGTTVWLSLDQTLDARNAVPGQPFTATVQSEIRSPNGELLIPRGARVEGRVADVRPAIGDQPAAIRLVLDGLNMADTRMPLQAQIIETRVPSQRHVRGTDVLIGGLGGAAIGGILEGGKGALIGGALGAGAGTLVSLGRGETHALPAGTQVAMQIASPIPSYAQIARRRGYY
jgi:hypothetical protein